MIPNFLNPDQSVQTFGLRHGAHVADLGAGVGGYSIPLAKIVGGGGVVYAVEVQKELVATLSANAKHAGVGNIHALWGDIERLGGTKIADHLCDAVVLANVLFLVEDKQGLVAEVSRILKPGGKVFVIDWTESFGGIGPHPTQVVSKESAQALFTARGFTFSRELPSGVHHYGIELVRGS